MTKSTMTPALVVLFGLILILVFQVSSLCLLIHLNTLSERGSGRDKLKLVSTEQPDKAPRKGDGRRDA